MAYLLVSLFGSGLRYFLVSGISFFFLFFLSIFGGNLEVTVKILECNGDFLKFFVLRNKCVLGSLAGFEVEH